MSAQQTRMPGAKQDGKAPLVEQDEQRRASEPGVAPNEQLVVERLPRRRAAQPATWLVPVGFGRKEPVASNRNPQGRELNRRVDVKILVNKSLPQRAMIKVSN